MAAHSKCALTLLLVCSVVTISGCGSASGGNSVVQISPTQAILTAGQQFQFNVVTGVPNPPQFAWQVNGVEGGSPTTGTISTSGMYTAPAKAFSQPVQISIRGQAAQATVSIFDSSQPNQGSVTATQNPLVAAYAIPVPDGGSAQVQFGTDTTYGLSTSVTSKATGGGVTTIYVAGMLQNTTYHMQATLNLPGGGQYTDADHTFTTGAIPAGLTPNISTELTGNGTAADGVELLDLVPITPTTALSAMATDLSGNIIWYYDMGAGNYPFPIKLLPNGHMLLVNGGPQNDVREIDLAGNIIHQITFDQIKASLGNVVSWGLISLNHDILTLPNGHLLLLASIQQAVQNVPGVKNGTEVQGNGLVDWDLDQGAVWTWSTFDHLEVSHAPYGLPDWTHGNSLLYSPDDGNLFFSMRNQSWIIKINYQDGTGDGSILWKFGPGGDFTLASGEAPIDWNYGQHDITLQSPNSTGIFSLMFFDNGNNRLVDSNDDVCGTNGVEACYSSVPIFQVNEYTKSASVLWQATQLPVYSICCGDALVLPNGNVEYDVAFSGTTPNVSYIQEVTQTDSPEVVWQMTITGQLAYRGFRIPSLYPGVTWPANAQQNVRKAAGASK